jgi:threonine dehydrogenase-like Zn-dependent dehydrogenase
MYLPWNAVLHRVPDGVTAELAGIVTPLSNGIEWALYDAGVGFMSSVLIQGPGQQGLSQVVACRQAGAALIVVTGTTRDAARLELARSLGADHVVDVQREDPLERVMEVTGGTGVDVVLDCTAGAGITPILLGIDALKRRAGTLLVQGELAAFPDFPLKRVTEKAITIKSARGHSYRAVELALGQLASHRFPLEALTTHEFALRDADRAIRAVGGEGVDGVIHVSLLPWKDGAP